jgi:acetoin utilization deacetylase AcuC-like enzyme
MALSIFYSPSFNDIPDSFDTFTKADEVAKLIQGLNNSSLALCEPRPATSAELQGVHAEEYLDALLTGVPLDLAMSNTLGWYEGLLAAVAASTGGLRDAALEALASGADPDVATCNAGSLSSGLHHARYEHGNGYCTINGLVVAARAALAAGARRVLILDLDAHCGGGTAELIDGLDGVEQLDISVKSFDSYSSREDAQLTILQDSAAYLDTIAEQLGAIAQPDEIDLILYNAGMDPHEHASGMSGITTEMLSQRESMVFEFARLHDIPVAFTLAGGYTGHGLTLEEVAQLHMLTVLAACAPFARVSS